MARTPAGNLRGAAARTQKADDRLEAFMREPGTTAIIDHSKQDKQIKDLMQACYDIEGDSFITWWEDDTQVPAKITRTDQIQRLGQRLARVRRSR